MGKPGRNGAPGHVNAGDSGTRQEVRPDGPPTRSQCGGYHLVQQRGHRKASSTRKINPKHQTLMHRAYAGNRDNLQPLFFLI